MNQQFHLTGRHAFRITLGAADGTHRYCAYSVNTGPSVSPARVPLGCRSVQIANDPVGAVDALSASSGTIHVGGWAYDPTRPGRSTSVQFDVTAHFRP